MNRVRLSDHFMFDELFSRFMCERYEPWQLRRLLVPGLVDTIEFIRTTYDHPIVINNWATGGRFQFSGFREPDTINPANKWFSITSQHARCNAVDMRPLRRHADHLRDFILQHESIMYDAGVRRLESAVAAPTWVHMDRFDDGSGRIVIFPR